MRPQMRPSDVIDRRGCAIGSACLSLSALAHSTPQSLLAALTAIWSDQPLLIPQGLRPPVVPLSRPPRPLQNGR